MKKVMGSEAWRTAVDVAWSEYEAARDDSRHMSRLPEENEAAHARVAAAYDALAEVMRFTGVSDEVAGLRAGRDRVLTWARERGEGCSCPSVVRRLLGETDEHAELKARIANLEGAARFLWRLLDDVDTHDDAAKGDGVGYRKAVRKTVSRRWASGITTDGYALDLTKAAAPPAEACPARGFEQACVLRSGDEAGTYGPCVFCNRSSSQPACSYRDGDSVQCPRPSLKDDPSGLCGDHRASRES